MQNVNGEKRATECDGHRKRERRCKGNFLVTPTEIPKFRWFWSSSFFQLLIGSMIFSRSFPKIFYKLSNDSNAPFAMPFCSHVGTPRAAELKQNIAANFRIKGEN